MQLSDLKFNPFEDHTVLDPREAQQDVPKVNEVAFLHLVRQFERVERLPRPLRRSPASRAHLVLSSEPGLGKTHLIGRLFRYLDHRSVPLFLPPFADAGSSWRSILGRVVLELSRPQPTLEGHEPTNLTRLDVLAYELFGRLLSRLLEQGELGGDNSQTLALWLRDDPLGTFGAGERDHYLVEWFARDFTMTLLPRLSTEMVACNLETTARANTWLKVLYAYTFKGEREACLEWISGEGLDDEERRSLGLMEQEMPVFEEGPRARNAVAFDRLRDLLALTGFHRPFLFCFDRAEVYAGTPEMVWEFGSVVDQLVNYGLNHLVVITSSTDGWDKLKEQQASVILERIDHRVINLVGATAEYAEQVGRLKLAAQQVEEEEANAFFEPLWVQSVFGGGPRVGLRPFLRGCAQRFEALVGCSLPKEQAPLGRLQEEYDYYFKRVLAYPSSHRYQRDAFLWSIGEDVTGGSFGGFAVSAAPGALEVLGFFSEWANENQRVYLGVEDSSYSKRWLSIVLGVKSLVNQCEDATVPRMVLLRAAQQKSIPFASWVDVASEMEAVTEYFGVYQLTEGEQRKLHACRCLYASAKADSGGFSSSELQEFIREKLSPFWCRLLRREDNG